ncbi:nucleoside triphosphate pyrophosphohydrolase [Sphingobacteriales bacterium UPWRP_1]|nr:nucleoside triphosphate pyrophosphohydrolase [Sphingobacteriales bacterium TSM_CSM]PSJ78824.1 nucleoside triphosphate pyrophosphohydrolase [Sphingobacteriales bacterium UPWRP_1]
MLQKLAAFERLLYIMNDLREKCPWDRKQTFESLRPLTIEETYELADAITENNLRDIKEELGDLLLHIVFYAKIGEEQRAFDIESIITTLCEKLIRRHPHIYGNVQVESEEEVKRNWEQLKLAEGKKSALEGVPVSLPALIKAVQIQGKARKVGFDWEAPHQVWDKVKEEIQELEEAVQSGNKTEQTKEFGDVLFALVNYARFLDIDPENALEKTNKKFRSRFMLMEEAANEMGKQLSSMTLAEMDVIWNETKKQVP